MSHMANTVYKTVTKCQLCALQGLKTDLQKNLHQYPAASLLEFVAAHVLSPIEKTKCGKQHGVLFIDSYRKVKTAIVVASVTSKSVLTVFVNQWVILYGTPTYLLINNGPKFVSKFYSSYRWSGN